MGGVNSPSKTKAMHFNETKMDFVYLDVRGWFSKKQFTDFVRDVQTGFVEIPLVTDTRHN